MNNVFLGPKGLTSSEANHVTNVAKEIVKAIEIRTSNMQLARATAFRGGEPLVLVDAKKTDIKGHTLELARIYSLSSWLKEGIKTKDRLMLNATVDPAYNPKPEMKPVPVKPSLTLGDYLETLTVKELNDYLTAEAYAAHIGKVIHNFDAVRKMFDEFQPTVFQKIGDTEVITVKQELVYEKEELLKEFFDMQAIHRDHEKFVNYHLAKHKDWVKEKEDDYSVELRKVNHENNEQTTTWRKELFNETEKAAAATRQLRKEISGLKIIIPNDLQPVLDYVDEYAKTK